jgi:hypothetical protein
MAFLHIYLKYTQPLFMQALMGLKGLYDSNEIALHIFGRKAEGDLKRPFVAPPGLLGCTSSFSVISRVAHYSFQPLAPRPISLRSRRPRLTPRRLRRTSRPFSVPLAWVRPCIVRYLYACLVPGRRLVAYLSWLHDDNCLPSYFPLRVNFLNFLGQRNVS